MILESLAWASVTLVSVPSPERALLVSLTLSWLLLFVNQQLWLQHLLPSPSCCEERGKPHWGQCSVRGKAAFCPFMDGQRSVFHPGTLEAVTHRSWWLVSALCKGGRYPTSQARLKKFLMGLRFHSQGPSRTTQEAWVFCIKVKGGRRTAVSFSPSLNFAPHLCSDGRMGILMDFYKAQVRGLKASLESL